MNDMLRFIQNGREVNRFHGLPVRERQRVDAHLYGQMSLIPIIVGPNDPVRAGQLLLATVYDGDIAEWQTGDMPSTTKRHLDIRPAMAAYEDTLMEAAGFNPFLPTLTEADRRVIKIADAAEGCLHCIKERVQGNRHPRLLECFYEFWKYVTVEQGLDSQVWLVDRGYKREAGEATLRDYLHNEWLNANEGVW